MKLVEVDFNKIANKSRIGESKWGRNQDILKQFANSNKVCARVDDWEHVSVKNAAIAFNRSAERLNMPHIHAFFRGNELYLVNMILINK